MPETSQSKAVKSYRRRLGRRGMTRFEVLGLVSDRDLIRALARRLAEGGKAATRLRAEVSGTLTGGGTAKGGIFAALRRSPLVGAEIEIAREKTPGRNVTL